MRTEDGRRLGLQSEWSHGSESHRSVGGVGVDAARRTRRRGDGVGVGGVLPAVSIQAMRGVEATT